MHYQSWGNVGSFYIHWPFCPYRCYFCPFIALAKHDQYMEQYYRALSQEIFRFSKQIKRKISLKTLFIGGGTPSTCPDALMLDMFGKLKKIFDFEQDSEITIEVNPGTVRIEQLALWKSIGINRLSIGVQSSKDSVLKQLNRHQTRDDIYFLLHHARGFFDNISVDLILGLPDVTENDWKKFLYEVVTWPITHVSIYWLMIHEQTPLYFKLKKQELTLPCDDTITDLYAWSIDLLAAHGFEQYEISNFARSGYWSRHNTVYWDRKPYKAFGLGACSFDGTSRFQNQINLGCYMRALAENHDVIMFSERLTKEQIHLETIMLELRRMKGVRYTTLLEGLSSEKKMCLFNNVTWLQEHNFIRERNGRLMLTPRGFAVENEIIRKLSL